MSRISRSLRLSLPGLAALAALAGCAQPMAPGLYVTQDRHWVFPLSQPGQFEVIGNAGDAGPQYFCAAGDYAWKHLNSKVVDRVVIIRPVGPAQSVPGRMGVVFEVMPRETAPEPSGIILNPREKGEAQSVAAAQNNCSYNLNPRDR